jgi:prepilin-type N-terminal cleavage/methylation domain-containing protein
MRLARSHRRPGFSLIEMVLALAIGMLLLLALYVAFNTYVSSAQTGRDAVTEATIARNVLNRMGNDILGQLGPDDVRVVDYPTLEAAPAPDAEGQGQAAVQPMVKFNTSVYGKEDILILSSYRVRKPTTKDKDDKFSDLTRTVYWIVKNGSKSSGLARAEIRQATHGDVDQFDPAALPDQQKRIIAPEVLSVRFEYADGRGGWSGEWDGETPLFDGGPSPGPPAAIRIVLTLRKNLKTVDDPDGDVEGPTYIQVIALPASNSFPEAKATQ